MKSNFKKYVLFTVAFAVSWQAASKLWSISAIANPEKNTQHEIKQEQKANAERLVSKPAFGQFDKTSEADEQNLMSIEDSLQSYKGQSVESLKEKLKSSQKWLAQEGLIEKSNLGKLSANERKILIQEIRLQAALSHLITEENLKNLRKKYL